MLGEAEQRVRAIVSKLSRRHREGTIALVVSQPLASLVRNCVRGDEIGDLWKAASQHGCWEVLEVVPETITPGG
jgi:hypothetical protein